MDMRKGQAAMEYLMTYGWAILIVIVVVAALYAMGVFRIGAPPIPCSPCFSYFAYVDYANGVLVLRSGAREINLTAFDPDPSVALTLQKDGTVFNPASADSVITPGTTIRVSGFSVGTTYSINVTYIDVISGLEHSDSATLKA